MAFIYVMNQNIQGDQPKTYFPARLSDRSACLETVECIPQTKEARLRRGSYSLFNQFPCFPGLLENQLSSAVAAYRQPSPGQG